MSISETGISHPSHNVQTNKSKFRETLGMQDISLHNFLLMKISNEEGGDDSVFQAEFVVVPIWPRENDV